MTTDQQADIRLQIRVKNARVMQAMEKAGVKTIAELARGAGIADSSLHNIVSFRRPPVNSTGWCAAALRVASFLHVEPEQLWPEYLQHVQARTHEVSIDLSVDELAALAERQSTMDQKLIAREEVQDLLRLLSTRSRTIVEMRYGLNGNNPHSWIEIGKAVGMQRSAAWQAAKQAFKVMREHQRRVRYDRIENWTPEELDESENNREIDPALLDPTLVMMKRGETE